VVNFLMKSDISIKMHYLDLGNPRNLPIILIHGMTFDHQMWNHQIQVLKDKYRVIAYDLRGHGLSTVGDGQYTYKMFTDDLIDLMDHLHIKQAVLCGLSMGGVIAIRAYEMNPDRIKALILCDTRSEADSNQTKYWREDSIELIKNKGLDAFTNEFIKTIFTVESIKKQHKSVELIRNVILSSSPKAICAVLLAQAARTDMKHVLPKIKVPTLIMIGENDNFTPYASSETMNNGIINSKLKIISKAGHISNLENKYEFNHNLLEFMKEIE
jgi:3-oxoadipate enol-lactonase